MGPSTPTKKFTDPNTNVEITVNKLEAGLTYLGKLDINEETRSYNKEKREYKKEILQVYYIIHSQCTDSMIRELQKYSPNEAVSDASDSVELLKLIKLICYTYKLKTNKPLALIKADKAFIPSRQAIDETNISNLSRYEMLVSSIAWRDVMNALSALMRARGLFVFNL